MAEELKTTDFLLLGKDNQVAELSHDKSKKSSRALSLSSINVLDEFGNTKEDKLWDLWLNHLALFPTIDETIQTKYPNMSECPKQIRDELEYEQMCHLISIWRDWSTTILKGGFSLPTFMRKFSKVVHGDKNFIMYRESLIKKYLTEDWRSDALNRQSNRLNYRSNNDEVSFESSPKQSFIEQARKRRDEQRRRRSLQQESLVPTQNDNNMRDDNTEWMNLCPEDLRPEHELKTEAEKRRQLAREKRKYSEVVASSFH